MENSVFFSLGISFEKTLVFSNPCDKKTPGKSLTLNLYGLLRPFGLAMTWF